MKNVKMWLGAAMVSACLFANTGTLLAQGQSQPAPAVGKNRAGNLKTNLGITDDQADKVIAIEKEENQKMKALRQSMNDERAAVRPQMQAIRKEKESRLAAVLSPDQMTRYKQMQAERRAQHQGKNSGTPPLPPPVNN